MCDIARILANGVRDVKNKSRDLRCGRRRVGEVLEYKEGASLPWVITFTWPRLV